MAISKLKFENNIIYRPDSNEFDDSPSLGHLLIKSLTNAGGKTVIINGITGEKLSAVKLATKSVDLAKGLLNCGVRPGDIVSIVSENRFEFAYILFGTIFLNCVSAPLNPTYSENELKHAFNLSKPKFIFVSNATIEKVSNVVKSLNYVKKLIIIDDEPINNVEGVTTLRDFTNTKLLKNVTFEPQAVDKVKTICLMVCSSGTTGLPKGVQLSQNNFIVAIRHTFLSTRATIDYEMIILGLLPLYHIYGCEILISFMATIPGKIILLQKFEEQTFLNSIQNYRCTNLFLVPPLMVFLSKNENVVKYDLNCVKIIYSGAAPLSKETEEAVKSRLRNPNLEIKQMYGMSELTSAVLSQKEILKPGSVGDANLGVYAKVIDKNGIALGPNRHGELCFKGTRVMTGYIGNNKETSAMIDKHGWLHTGDIGYYDNDLQFYVVDRIKELIKWKGFQVAPAGWYKLTLFLN